MRRDPLTIRTARPEDADGVVPLMHESSRMLIDATFGPHAVEILRHDFRRGKGIFGYRHQLVGVTDAGAVAATLTAYPGAVYRRLSRQTTCTAVVHFGPLSLAGVARRSLAVAGLFTPPRRDAMFLANLRVADPFRGAGVGSRLIDHVTRVAHGHGLECVELDVSFGNVRAQRLYERLGFVATGERPACTGSGLDGFRRMRLPLSGL
jgi:ribosomal protein S18 acetylase RimI-like enzyme